MTAHNMQPQAAATSLTTVLVANRGEIAFRIIRTLRDNGIRSVAVYSDADADAPHVRMADMAVHIGPSAARESYLVIDKIIDAARRSGADGIHPGYGFLSENADFAIACEKAGIEFIGPSASAINTMGDKISARAAVEARDVPTVPGLSRPGLADEDLIEAAPSIGFPVLIKPSAGGGGKGMHRVENAEDLPAALATARREAAGAFGDDSLFIEHFVDTPRHIEVQILADKHGNVIHLGERECSLQRRHQKVIEEAPSPLLDEKTRAAIGEAACDAARSVGYVGAGTVEFIVPAKDPSSFYFMEMNTRLQVEHPVTEQVTGLDLVALQVEIASGKSLPIAQDDVTLTGHAIEARVYAEDPAAGFLPTGGTVSRVIEPRGAGVRVDSGIVDGSEVSSLYDPMLMKIISYGDNREQALERLDQALGDTVVAGVGVNIDFCRYLLNIPEVRAGELDTGLLDRVAEGFATTEAPDDVYIAAAMSWLTTRFDAAIDSPWLTPDGWRASEPASQRIRFGVGESSRLISIVGTPSLADVIVGDVVAGLSAEADNGDTESPEPRNYTVSVYRDGERLRIVRDGVAQHFLVETIDSAGSARREEYVVTGAHGTWVLPRTEVVTAGAEADTSGSGAVHAPMPGAIIALSVEEGTHVEAGAALLVMEAMKMEHTLTAEVAGEVSFAVAPGDQVTGDQQLATITVAEAEN
ncbi:MAG: acetyl/propionyl/methylcrotonyl-CoA carboxylase subunit alpha [Corynebacterium sp.]|uniref:acetyl-CoA carboxylase biotin carboxylase subunit n=1 Tax=Corynebacterium sp. TaxID=1720 RepID=UPI0026DCFD56|nr:acetyl/propionyl/methylcrotonyl-CoA carboxylase subunit alpha [Corynebacterium sp.]MDO5030167.1 acetyl/propionyl/methylcrotonyl-CoA carboxylase subunit alpha [Corynebacterium sp.]